VRAHSRTGYTFSTFPEIVFCAVRQFHSEFCGGDRPACKTARPLPRSIFSAPEIPAIAYTHAVTAATESTAPTEYPRREIPVPLRSIMPAHNRVQRGPLL